MNDVFALAMGRALDLTRSSDLAGATRTIQEALGTRSTDTARNAPAGHSDWRDAVEDAELVEEAPAGLSRTPGRRPLGETLAVLRQGRGSMSSVGRRSGLGSAPDVPTGSLYTRRRFASRAGSRAFTLYVPASLPEGPKGLILMLHGCTQDADDFARGTAMNTVADREGLIIAYPEQARVENAQGCWNWFRPSDQHAGRGEPEILAGLARELVAEFGVDPARVYVAGLSAGGAMAAVLGVTHPQVFRAVGVHSGLPHGCAQDVVSAFAAMRGDPGPATPLPVPVVVFHGTADMTVSPVNGKRMLRGLNAAEITTGHSRGRSWQRHVADGSELWLVDGAGHAWSGGSRLGSYTDPAGPDASAEMVRFFLAAP